MGEHFLLIAVYMFFVFGIGTSILVVGSMIIDFELDELSFHPCQLIPVVILTIGLIGFFVLKNCF